MLVDAFLHHTQCVRHQPDNRAGAGSLKETADINKPLLGTDPTSPTSRVIGGVPLYVSPEVGTNIVWGIPMAHSLLVYRQDATVVTDTSVFFTRDRVAVRATLRASFGFTYPLGIVKINITP